MAFFCVKKTWQEKISQNWKYILYTNNKNYEKNRKNIRFY